MKPVKRMKYLLRDFVELDAGQNPADADVRNEPKRREVIELLEQLRTMAEVEFPKSAHGYMKPNAKFLAKTNHLFDLLNDYFLPTVPPTENDMVIEISHILQSLGEVELDDSVWMECYNSGFTVLVVRHALKYFKLPIIQASGWKSFAINYSGLVIAA